MKKFILLLLAVSFLSFLSCNFSDDQVSKSTVIDEGDFKFLKIEGTNSHPDLYLLLNKDGTYVGTQYKYSISSGKTTTTHVGIVEVSSDNNNNVQTVIKNDISVDDAIIIISNYLSEIDKSNLSESDKFKQLSKLFNKVDTLSSSIYHSKNEAYKNFIDK